MCLKWSLEMENIKLKNIQRVYLNGKKVTMFDVYSVKENSYVFDYSDYILGWFKNERVILIKHKAFNCK